MKRSIIQLGTLAIACAFSTMAFGQALRLDVKPRGEAVRDLMKPGAVESTVKTAAPKGMEFKPAANDNKKPANDNVSGDQCNMGPLNAGELYNKVSAYAPDIDLYAVQNLIKNGYLTRGVCKKPLESLSAEALANAIRLARELKDCLSGQSPVNHPKAKDCQIQANMKVLGLSYAEAKENAEGLEECAYNGQKAAAL